MILGFIEQKKGGPKPPPGLPTKNIRICVEAWRNVGGQGLF